MIWYGMGEEIEPCVCGCVDIRRPEASRTILYILFCLVVYLERESINPRRKYISINNVKLIHRSKNLLILVLAYTLLILAMDPNTYKYLCRIRGERGGGWDRKMAWYCILLELGFPVQGGSTYIGCRVTWATWDTWATWAISARTHTHTLKYR